MKEIFKFISLFLLTMSFSNAWLIADEQPWVETPLAGYYDLSNAEDSKPEEAVPINYGIDPKEIAKEKPSRESLAQISPYILHPKPVQDALYRLKFGDRLYISVYGEEHTKREVVVGPDGNINFLFVNSVPAVGRTIAEVRHSITEELKKYYRFPLLIMAPLLFSNEYYTVIGEVNAPGSKPITADSTVLSALCEAQGFTTRLFRNQTVDTVDLDRSFLIRNGEYIRIDFESLLEDGDLSWNIPLKGGDYLHFATAGIHKVFVLGEVNRNTVTDYLDGLTLTQAIADAAGLTNRASSRVLIIRGSLAYPRWYYIDFNLISRAETPDFPLMPKDIVYVPPMRFSTLKDIVRGGISYFVNIAANVAGTNAFFEIYPRAKGSNVISPVPVVGVGAVQPPPVTPVVP